jgi:hypothetical protein
MSRKLLSAVLAAVLAITLLPVQALAFAPEAYAASNTTTQPITLTAVDLGTEPLPAEYDPREQDPVAITPLKSQVTGVYRSTNEGLCADYAAVAVLEQYQMRTQRSSEIYSEGFYDYYNTSVFPTPTNLPSTVKGSGEAMYPHDVMDAMIDWYGPVSETTFPTGAIDEMPFDQWNTPPELQVQGYQRIPGIPRDSTQQAVNQRIELIKQLIWRYGAVAFRSSNHAFALVGWDDDYDYMADYGSSQIDRMYDTSLPGAFLVKNSWGVYNYEPYYDNPNIYTYQLLVITQTQPADTYAQNLHLSNDVKGTYANLGGNGPATFANIYTTPDPATGTTLAAVGFYNNWENIPYSIYVNPAGTQLDTEHLVKVQEGTFGWPGFETIALDTPINIPPGTGQFAVAVELGFPATGTTILNNVMTRNLDNASAVAYMSTTGMDNWQDTSAAGWTLNMHAYTTTPAQAGAAYTVTYDANGGSGAPAAQSKSSGETLVLSTATPTRQGYSFLGWATAPSARGASYQPGAEFIRDTDITLYAVWCLPGQDDGIVITLDLQGGTGDAGPLVKTPGVRIRLPRAHTAGYIFKGWSRVPGTTVVDYAANAYYAEDQSQTFYAVYEVFEYYIDPWSTKELLQLMPGETYNLEVAGDVASNTDYYFIAPVSGYYTCPDLSSREYAYFVDENGYSGITRNSAADRMSSPPAGYPRYRQVYLEAGQKARLRVVLPAAPRAQAINYQIITPGVQFTYTLDLNDGSGVFASQQKTDHEPLLLDQQVPTREGHAFLYWSLNRDALMMQGLLPINQLFAPGDMLGFDRDMTLYAIWDDFGDTEAAAYEWTGVGSAGTSNLAGAYNYWDDVDYVRFTVPKSGGYDISLTGDALAADSYRLRITRASDGGSMGGYDTKYTAAPDNIDLVVGEAYYAYISKLNGAPPADYALTITGPDEPDEPEFPLPTFAPADKNVGFNELVCYTNDGSGGVFGPVQEFATYLVFVLDDVPVREGYEFAGWNTAADGSGKSYAAGKSYFIIDSLELYALWEVDTGPVYDTVLSAEQDPGATYETAYRWQIEGPGTYTITSDLTEGDFDWIVFTAPVTGSYTITTTSTSSAYRLYGYIHMSVDGGVPDLHSGFNSFIDEPDTRTLSFEAGMDIYFESLFAKPNTYTYQVQVPT